MVFAINKNTIKDECLKAGDDQKTNKLSIEQIADRI